MPDPTPQATLTVTVSVGEHTFHLADVSLWGIDPARPGPTLAGALRMVAADLDEPGSAGG